MTVNAGDVVAHRARVQALRCRLGAHLAMYRIAAGVSQPHLGHAIGRTPSMISRIEHGTRGMPEALWKITDQVCQAEGALITEYHTLAKAEQDYRAQCRAHRFQVQQQAAQAQVEALNASLVSSSSQGIDLVAGHGIWPGVTGVDGELAKELLRVVRRLVRLVGRRQAVRLVWSVLAAVGLSELDPEECTRLAQAVDAPGRVDARVINNLAISLAQCKRLEDTLGPCDVLDIVIAQHELVRLLLEGGCPDRWRKSLSVVDSTMACTIGGYLIDMGHPEQAIRYFARARRAGHDAGNPTCSAYAAINTSFAAFLRADTPTALDSAAAARSLAARTDDPRLKALAEEQAAGAFALDGQYRPCMVACDRAHDFLANTNGNTPDSPAYWVHQGTLDSKRSTFFSLLGKPHQAVEAASNARGRFDRTYVGLYLRCQIRLGHALVLAKDITQATRILGETAQQASLSPRLTKELHTARALLQPWNNTHALTTLDAQLEACGLLPPHQTGGARRA